MQRWTILPLQAHRAVADDPAQLQAFPGMTIGQGAPSLRAVDQVRGW
jgi:hypothetical protein